MKDIPYQSFLPFFEKICKNLTIINYLEWGCGLTSTVLAYKNKFNVVSIEHDEKWVKNLSLMGCDVVKKRLLQDTTCEYTNYPFTLNRKFDFILVDGRNRVICLKYAKQLLTSNGIVLLHNANIEEYKPGINIYQYKIWDKSAIEFTVALSNYNNMEFLNGK